MNENQRYFRLEKNTTIGVNLLQGGLATLNLFVRGMVITPGGILFCMLWTVGIINLFLQPTNTEKEMRNYKILSTLSLYVTGYGIAAVFDNEVLILTTMVVQWMTVVLTMDFKLCRVLCYGQIVAAIGFHVLKPFQFFTIQELVVVIFVILIANWCASGLVQILKSESDINKYQNASMDDMLSILDMKFEEANASNAAKGNFLANMSHEIRTPINSILGFNTMILRECADEKVREYAYSVQSAGRTLLNIVNDILDFSKIEAGKLEIIPVEYDASSLVFDEISIIETRAKEKGLEFIADIDENIPSWLYGDDVRIKQVITNLLTNAVKYTSNGSVTFKIECELDGDIAHLHVSIIDTGAGIREEDLSKLFETFVRIEEKRNRNIEGTGLGINIVTSLLTAMGSKLEVESEYNKGSNFHFHIDQKIIQFTPIGDINERKQAAHQDEEFEVSFTAPNARILVVDDNAMNRTVFANLLKPLECQVDDASSGKECVMILSQYKYDIIFMDHMMPGWDGIETFHKINELSEEENLSKGCPIIILTANAVAGAKEMYLNEGFNDFLSKPIIPEDLNGMIKKYLPPELVKEGAPVKKKTASFDVNTLPKVQGVDWTYGYLHLPSEELLMGTVKNFYQMIGTEATELEDYLMKIDESDEAVDSFRIKVHAMKSSATLWGALPIGGTAAMLEFASRDRDLALVKSVAPFFLQEWRGYKEKLKPLVVDEEAEAEKEAYDAKEVSELLDELASKTSCFDVHGADEALEKIKAFKYPEEIDVVLEKIAGTVMNLDVDNITAYCEEMKALLR